MVTGIRTPDPLGPDPEPPFGRLGSARSRALPDPAGPHRVVIAGAGVAGLEALAALRAHAGDRVSITVLDPGSEFVIQAHSVEEPFARPAARRYPLATVCADHRAELRRDALGEVEFGRAWTRAGDELPFDSLVVAVGARRETAYPDALTFRDARDAERMHGLIQDLEAGYLHRIAFVVPPGVVWTLPLYELALMTAERADSLCLDRVSITVVTPEARPLEAFGTEAGAAVADALRTAGIELRTRTEVASVRNGTAYGTDGGRISGWQRVVALPRLVGPAITGLPRDRRGFIPSDPYARVYGLRGVYAVGDGSTQPIKQGGAGARQAVAAARHIAARAGAGVAPIRFEPSLRAKLLTGSGARFLRRTSPDAPATVSERALWWPPAKVVAPHLMAYLARIDRGEHGPAPLEAAARFGGPPEDGELLEA